MLSTAIFSAAAYKIDALPTHIHEHLKSDLPKINILPIAKDSLN